MSRFSLRRSAPAVVVGVLAVASALAACSTEVEVPTTATGVVTPTPVLEADAAGTEAPTSPPPADGDFEPDPQTDDSEADDSEADGSASSPAGPLHTPARGEPVAVVGVAFDETVAVRSAARPGAPIVTELPALFDDAIGTGQGRTDEATGWWRIRVGGEQGWVDASSMARLGATTDVTSEVVATLGRTPAASNMRELGRLVTRARLDDDGEARVVLSAAPRVGDLGEIVYDILDRSDASIAGERLVVFATPTGGGDGFELRSVEATVLCTRGVTAAGRCT